MRQRMTPEQLDGWLAYSLVEPFGAERDDLRGAKHTQALAAAWGAEYTIDDLLPDFDGERSEPAAAAEETAEVADARVEMEIEKRRRIVAMHNAANGV